MKTERRHELQSNVLAGELGKFITWIAPYLKWIAWGTLAAAVLFGAFTIWSYFRASDEAAGWQEYMDAMATANPTGALQDLANARADDPVALWAHLTLADTSFREGSQRIYQNREVAERSLADAKDAYQEILDANPRSTLLRQRAEYGLAQTFETLGELKNARTHYEKVVELGAETALGKQAGEQVKALKDNKIRGFYDWFVAQKSAPAPGEGFDLDNLRNLPDSPDFDMNELLNRMSTEGGGTAGGGTAGGGTAGGESSAADPEADPSLLRESLPGADETPANSSETPSAQP